MTPTLHRWGSVALRQRLLAPWLARAGIGVAVALPFSAGGLPLTLFVIWIATVGIALRPRRS